MNDQPAYVTREEFERRMRALESETEGEKTVTRHILTETRQNSGDLATIKAQITHLAGDMILVNAALNNHGTRLNVLTQDVREIRTRLNGVDARLGGMDAKLGGMDAKLDGMDAKLDAVLTVIRAPTPRDPPTE
jgi:chromosome segregation ATPase